MDGAQDVGRDALGGLGEILQREDFEQYFAVATIGGIPAAERASITAPLIDV